MEKNTALLIGAGFSYPAGSPLMYDLAKDFPRELAGNEKKIYQELQELVPEIGEDFELLMEVCHDLKEVPVTLLNRLACRCFGEEMVNLKQMAQGARLLERKLKGYLREQCKVNKGQLHYLYPLFENLKRTGQKLDVFTLNYDLMIEILCEEYYIPYTDGFEVRWNPVLFQDPSYQIRLYKLHGSFIWYQSELGERIKIPIVDREEQVEYLAQDGVVSMMVYPRQEKWEPFEELLRLFRERLLTLDQLVVIGYSFRDQELLKMVTEGLQKNHHLQLELVSPSAQEHLAQFSEYVNSKRLRAVSGGVEEWILDQYGKEKKAE